MNSNYDHKDLNAEQPKVSYIDENGNNRYDNSKAYNDMTKDSAVFDLYNLLIEEMQNAQKNYRTKNFSSLIKRRFIIGSYVLQKENQERYFINAQRVRRLIVDIMKDYFETINTPNKAYLLGFITADGAVTGKHKEPTCCSIEVKDTDKDVILFAKQEINPESTITICDYK